MKANHVEIWACTDCTMVHANGESGEQDPNVTPWSMLDEGDEVTAGGMSYESDNDEDRADEDKIDFSTRTCDGCGQPLAGERYRHTLWYDEIKL